MKARVLFTIAFLTGMLSWRMVDSAAVGTQTEQLEQQVAIRNSVDNSEQPASKPREIPIETDSKQDKVGPAITKPHQQVSEIVVVESDQSQPPASNNNNQPKRDQTQDASLSESLTTLKELAPPVTIPIQAEPRQGTKKVKLPFNEDFSLEGVVVKKVASKNFRPARPLKTSKQLMKSAPGAKQGQETPASIISSQSVVELADAEDGSPTANRLSRSMMMGGGGGGGFGGGGGGGFGSGGGGGFGGGSGGTYSTDYNMAEYCDDDDGFEMYGDEPAPPVRPMGPRITGH